MKLLTSITAIFLMISATAMPQMPISIRDESPGIEFHSGTWEEALQIAAKEGKPLFLDISASWCGPCKLLKANTFTDDKVGNYFNSNFVNVAVDGQKGEGVDLARKYHIRGYPTMIFLDSEGEVISRIVGYHDPKELIESGKQVLSQ